MSAQLPVFVVDDDEAVRDSLGMLLRTCGLEVETFGSALDCLQRLRTRAAGCLVLDICMPGLSGTALQEELNKRRVRVPVIFLTAHGAVPLAVAALKKGAYDFIEKPFDEQRLVFSVLTAMRSQQAQLAAGSPEAADLAGVPGLETLSDRERQVLERILSGASTRAIAEELHITAKTVEFHRARIRAKLRVTSMAELYRVCLGAPRDTTTKE